MMGTDVFYPEYAGETVYEHWVAYRKTSLALSIFFFVLFIPTLLTADTVTSVRVFFVYAAISQGFALFAELIFFLIGSAGQKNRELSAKVLREGRVVSGRTCRVLEIVRSHGPLVSENQLASSASSSYAFVVQCAGEGLEFVTDEFDEVPEAFLLHRCTCDVHVLGDRAYCDAFWLTDAVLRQESVAVAAWEAWRIRQTSY